MFDQKSEAMSLLMFTTFRFKSSGPMAMSRGISKVLAWVELDKGFEANLHKLKGSITEDRKRKIRN